MGKKRSQIKKQKVKSSFQKQRESRKKRESRRKQDRKEKVDLKTDVQDITIRSITPLEAKQESREIYSMLKLNKGKQDKETRQDLDIERPQLSLEKGSFSPKINRELVSLKTVKAADVFKCRGDLLSTNIGSKCLPYTSKQVQSKLLKNLKASKHLDCSRFIAPKQYNSNCWFNTLFVTFFFSDKGRKFFRFLRQLMITGKKVNGDPIPDELAEVFFTFNKIIEGSYNQDGNADHKLIANYNTNFFIENIYNILLKRGIVTYKKNQSGNPLEYYLAIIKYLNYDAVNVLSIDISSERDFEKIGDKLRDNGVFTPPEVLIIEIIDDDAKTIQNRPLEFTMSDNDSSSSISYRLDAAILRDISRQHFCSLLTCNSQQYSFDGASYSRLTEYKWKDVLNRPTKWGFEGHPLKWSFLKSYQMLFYYRV